MRLSVKQVIASVVGAILAALALSSLGAAGTIVGVAVGSAAATIGSALVFHSLDRGHEKVRQIVKAVAPPESGQTPLIPTGLDAEPALLADARAGIASVPEAESLASLVAPTRRRWSIIAAVGLVFVISIGVVTALELALGRPLNSEINGSSTLRHTSIGEIIAGPGPTTTSTTSATTTSTTTTTHPASTTTTKPKPKPTTTTTTSRPTTTTTSSTTTTVPESTTTTSSQPGL